MSGAGDESVPREDPREKDTGDQLPEEQQEPAVVDADPDDSDEPEPGATPPP